MSDTDTTPGDRMSAPAQRRGELAAFLRSRRERITPEQAGLPTGHRRRTSGLRREEVAQLAGVGVTWYTWLEQGRPINASTQVLDAVARTLMLDPVERSICSGWPRHPMRIPPSCARSYGRRSR